MDRSSCITSQQRGDQTGRVQACCQCNYTALLELSGLDPNDIVFGTFHSAVSKSKLQGCYPSSFSRDYGLDTEGLNLVGRSSSGLHCEHCPHGYTAPNISSPDGSPACLESSVSFQEEMDQKCMEGSAYPELVPRLQRWLENCLACVCECYCGKDGAARVVTQLHSAVCFHCIITFHFSFGLFYFSFTTEIPFFFCQNLYISFSFFCMNFF